MLVSKNKYEFLERLSSEKGLIGALAIDQRGSIKKMMGKFKENVSDSDIVEYKELVSENLTKYSTSILLDPEYGLLASRKRNRNCGLLLAYEKTGYDATKKGRLPDILDDWSVRRLKEEGADAIKFLLYYDVDDDKDINEQKHIFVERLGSECLGEDIPFFLEIVSYSEIELNQLEYAKVRPRKVIEAMKEFSKPRYNVDVLKVEIPVDMNYVEGYAKEEVVYTKEEALKYYKEQSDATDLPYIFLSGGVDMELFKESLRLAKKANAKFNGVLCGRATWKDSVKPYSEFGIKECVDFLNTECRDNICGLNEVLEETATSWKNKIYRK